MVNKLFDDWHGHVTMHAICKYIQTFRNIVTENIKREQNSALLPVMVYRAEMIG